MNYAQKQLRDMSVSQLDDLLKQLRGELRQMRFLAKHGEFRQVHQMKQNKKSIARIMSLKSQARTQETAAPLTDEVKQA